MVMIETEKTGAQWLGRAGQTAGLGATPLPTVMTGALFGFFYARSVRPCGG